MILALPDEFFKDWEWQAGDKLFHKKDKELYMVSRVTEKIYAYQFERDPSRLITFFTPGWRCVRPIPNQEQLQEILKSRPTKLKEKFSAHCPDKITDGWLLLFFNEYIEFLSPSIWNIEFRGFWLMFVMFVLYDQEWNGSEWL